MGFYGMRLLEVLEPRTLLSASFMGLMEPIVHGDVAVGHSLAAAPTIGSTKGVGKTLNLVVGTAFSGEVAFFPSPVLDPPDTYAASIAWGDGTTSNATLQYATENGAGGYQIIGSHTYNAAGTYKTTTTVFEKMIAGTPGGPVATPIILVATIVGKAVVIPGNSAGGVTLQETTNHPFTAPLGSFITIAPATHLTATINWGDGKTSAGTIVSTGVVGLDTIQFQVSGTHTYAVAGTYGIQIKVTKPGLSSAMARMTVATIDSTAVVTAPQALSLAGTLTGTYTNPLVPIDVGRVYSFKGSGTAGTLGAVTVSGNVGLPGFIMTALITGTLTLVNAHGSVTLSVSRVECCWSDELPEHAVVHRDRRHRGLCRQQRNGGNRGDADAFSYGNRQKRVYVRGLVSHGKFHDGLPDTRTEKRFCSSQRPSD